MAWATRLHLIWGEMKAGGVKAPNSEELAQRLTKGKSGKPTVRSLLPPTLREKPRRMGHLLCGLPSEVWAGCPREPPARRYPADSLVSLVGAAKPPQRERMSWRNFSRSSG